MSLTEKLYLKYYQYELTTALYMLEPWEKACFNSIVLIGFSLALYTAVIYIPEYATSTFTKLSAFY
ncbi:hypothetical protein K493DRAFT_313729 [Basidiobolus meristosporus CBS 931.73]|uniref:Serine palmitoyltransferase small subunit B n=1 Tax=Basidiobolus meristosporus CBS 931.73 TaxID=1314790 RepID=A0A1Y1YJP7_9FUNG|nr:hypothetical protein K493DRAFT_313729 [Basidiobolus meristosporus CBS 931.73]|eukprot:ORX98229.1 hypothetical protein K493DRAFT_313729 [Basidiobolus meristosporus CBS 931.73]